jgi:hypothetical protein
MREYKLTVPEVLPRVRAIYSKPEGGVGCCLHLVLDDGNTNDSSVEFCIGIAEERGHADCVVLGRMLRSMSKTQRAKLGRAK